MPEHFETPRYSVSQVNKAGRRYISEIPKKQSDGLRDEAEILKWAEHVRVVDNWRASHAYPLGKIRDWLARHSRAVTPKANTSQRLKRISSIDTKLWAGSRLSKIQDIAGCRAVVPSTGDVPRVIQRLRQSNASHELVDETDYIASPKSTGYRSAHLVYAFCSDRYPAYKGLLCEIQVRTEDQHAWATAVELVGFFLNQDLKAGKGHKVWLRFFQVVAALVAIKENCEPIPGIHADRRILRQEVNDLADELNFHDWLSGIYFVVPKARAKPGEGKLHWYLIRMNTQKRKVSWKGYTVEDTDSANTDYARIEQQIRDQPGEHIVLVSADGLKGLRAAYPSFFGDAEGFRRIIGPLLYHSD